MPRHDQPPSDAVAQEVLKLLIGSINGLVRYFVNASTRSLRRTPRVKDVRINENDFQVLGGAGDLPGLGVEVARHDPPVVPPVLVVVDLSLRIEVVVMVAKNRVPRNLQTGCVVDGGVGLVPERVDVAGDAVLVEVVAERYHEISSESRGIGGHQSCDRGLVLTRQSPVSEGKECEIG